MTPRTPKPISDLVARAQADLELARAAESSAQEMLDEAMRRRTQIEGFLNQLSLYSGIPAESVPRPRRVYEPAMPGTKQHKIQERIVGLLKAAKGRPLSPDDLWTLVDASPDGELIVSSRPHPSARRHAFSAYLSRITHSSHGPIMQRADKLLVLTGQETLA